MTLKVRIIPCRDVKDGRVVKGVNFVDLVDAREFASTHHGEHVIPAGENACERF